MLARAGDLDEMRFDYREIQRTRVFDRKKRQQLALAHFRKNELRSSRLTKIDLTSKRLEVKLHHILMKE
jgi:hypothetical protein